MPPPLFQPSSLVARPPFGIDQKLRLTLEAIAFSMESIQRSIGKIERYASSQLPETRESNLADDTAELMGECWSVVDQLYALSGLLSFLSRSAGPRAAAILNQFIGKYHGVTSALRNVFRHLDARIPNLAKQKKIGSTVFGSISFVQYDENSTRTGIIGVISFGAFSPGGNVVPSASAPLLDEPRSGIQFLEFSAYGESLKFWELASDLPILAKYLERTAEDSILPKIAEASNSQGIPVEQLLNQPPNAFLSAIRFELDPQSQASATGE